MNLYSICSRAATVFALLAAMSGCGGGGDAAVPTSTLAAELKRLVPIIADASLCVGPASADSGSYDIVDGQCVASTRLMSSRLISKPYAKKTVTADAFFVWAQGAFQAFFPGAAATVTANGFVYRAYSNNNIIAITTAELSGLAPGAIFILGPVTSNALLNVGTLNTFSCTVDATTCAAPATNIQMGGARQGTALTVAAITGIVPTFVPAGQFNAYGITTDGTNLYVADSYDATILKVVIATGAVTTLAGTKGSVGLTNGVGSAAQFLTPFNITTDGTSLFVTDNHAVRKVDIATGTVTTLAGSVLTSGTLDGVGAAARFNTPHGITTDGVNLYVADTVANKIRKVVIATGAVTTLATVTTPGAAIFGKINGITTDGTYLYATATGTIMKIDVATGAVTTLAGTTGTAGATDGTGAAARFALAYGITCDGTNLYVSDQGNGTVRKVVIATGVVTTLASSTSGLSSALDITTDGNSLYVMDLTTIRKIH